MRFASAKIIKEIIFNNNVIYLVILLFIAVITGIAIAEKNKLYFGVVFLPFILYICIEKPFFFPLGLYVFTIPLDAVLSVSGSTSGATLTKLLGILTILVLSVKGALEKKLVKPDFASIWWLLFVMYGLLSILWAIMPEAVLNRLPTAFGLLLLYLVVASYQIQKNEFESIKWCILFGGLLTAILIIYNYKSGLLNPEISHRATLGIAGRASDPNRAAAGILIPCAVCIGFFLKQRIIAMKGLFGIILGVMLFAVIVTGARNVMLGVAAVFIVYILSVKRKTSFLIILSIIGIILMSFLPELFYERWGSSVETRGSGRLDIWYVGLMLLEKYWLLGAGLDNFPVAYSEFAIYAPNFKGYFRGAHNTYLGFFVELGIVGISLMILAMWKHYKVIQSRFNQYNIDAFMLKAAFWGILIAMFFGDKVWSKTFWLLWMMILMYRNVLIHYTNSDH